MAWTEASNVLNGAGLPEFLRRRTTSSSSSTVPAEEEFLQEIASVIPKNIVAQRLKFLEKGNSSTSETNQNISSNCNQEAQSLVGDKKNSSLSSSSTGAAISSPVDKRHAVLAYEPTSNCFTVRDLNTSNGTFVNNRKLCGDHPETVSNLDVLRFGYDIRFIQTNASLNSAASGAQLGGVGPSSLPPTLNSYTKPDGYAKSAYKDLERYPLSRSISTEDNSQTVGIGLPPKGFLSSNSAGVSGNSGNSSYVKRVDGSAFLPRKSLLTKKNSDPGGIGVGCISSGIFSERLSQFQRRSSGANFHETGPASTAAVSSFGKKCGDKSIDQQYNNVMQQAGRSGTSGVSSPSLTLDSGRGSSSAPSSPAKEMSPVQMTTATTSSGVTSPTGMVGGGSSSLGTTSSSPSHNASPVFARKLSRPMEYLLGQQQQNSPTGESADCGDPGIGGDALYSGNYTSFCSGSEPISFATNGSCGSAASASFNHASPMGRSGGNAMVNRGTDFGKNVSCGFPSDCEILQITEDFENDNGVGDSDDVDGRKDSLEEDEEVDSNLQDVFNGSDSVTLSSAAAGSTLQQPKFLVGGDIMQPDLNVPNEVFGPVSHAEILSRNNVGGASAAIYKNINNNLNNSNFNSQHSSGDKQGNSKPVLVEGFTHHAPRARSSSGGGSGGGADCGTPNGGSNRSTPLSALYGTPHWWPDSPTPEENICPPPPASSANASPFKKPFLLNNNITNRLKGTSSLSDHVKDLSLESTHSSHKSHSSSPAPSLVKSPSVDENEVVMASEAKKLTPMAFTIDLSDNSESGGLGGNGCATTISEAAEAKKAAIAERLSKFAPRHRRNASLTKNDDVLVGTTESSSPKAASSSLSLPKQAKSSSSNVGGSSSSLGRTNHQQRQSSLSTSAAESSSKYTSLPKKLPSTPSAVGCASISKNLSGGSNNDSGLRSLSPETISSTTSSSSRSRPVVETKPEEIVCSLASMGRKSGGTTAPSRNLQAGSRAGTPASRRSPGDGIRNTYQHQEREKADNINAKLNDLSKGVTLTKATIPPPPPVLDKEDTVSEAGTYTVEKETPDVFSARESIDRVFGVNDDDDLDKENNLVSAARASESEVDQSYGVVTAEPGTRDWVREWAELAAQQHQQKKHQRPELPDSQYFLRETETLVSAIQERVSKHMKSGADIRSSSLGAGVSDSDDDDEPTLSHHTPVKSQSQHSTPTNTGKRRPPSRSSPFHRESSVLSDSGYAIGYQSDSSNEGSSSATTHNQLKPPRAGRASETPKSHHGNVTNKMNRAFNIRRGGGRNFGYESTSSTTDPLHMINSQQSRTSVPLNNTRGISPKPAQVNSLTKCNNVGANNSSSSSPHFGRNDGGRFSLRMSKSRTPPAQMPPPAPRQALYSGGPAGEPHGRAAMNGHSKSESREQSVGSNSGGGKKYTSSGKVLNSGGGSSKKSGGNRSNSTLTAKEVELANWKRRKNYDPMKAAAEGKKGGSKKNGMSASSGAESGVEESAALPPIASSSPQVNRREAMMTKSLSFHQESYSPKCPSEEDDMIYIVDEIDSSNSNSPNHLAGGGITGMTRSYHEDTFYGMSNSSAAVRPKNKLEALDNLVIATIHSLSNKVRTSSRHLLEKLQVQHANDENGALLEEMVSQLKELEVPSNNSSPNKSPSRELSGTLKNLKKLEQVVLVLDKVLCDGFESDVNG